MYIFIYNIVLTLEFYWHLHYLVFLLFKFMLFSMICNISCGVGIRPVSNFDQIGTSGFEYLRVLIKISVP